MTTGKTPVKNQDLWMLLDAAVIGLKIEWKWVRGHSGHTENERVDKLARDEAFRVEGKVT
jgi:ribonuclease HI